MSDAEAITKAALNARANDLPTPERWLIGRMEVDGQHYKHAIFVSFATIEEFREAVRQVDGWFNS